MITNPRKAEGFGGVLRTIQHQPFGNLLLGAVTLGLPAFGLRRIGAAIFAQVKRDKSGT